MRVGAGALSDDNGSAVFSPAEDENSERSWPGIAQDNVQPQISSKGNDVLQSEFSIDVEPNQQVETINVHGNIEIHASQAENGNKKSKINIFFFDFNQI